MFGAAVGTKEYELADMDPENFCVGSSDDKGD